MWFAWFALTIVLIATTRYFRHYWRRAIYIHVTMGISIFIFTTVGAFMAWVILKDQVMKASPGLNHYSFM